MTRQKYSWDEFFTDTKILARQLQNENFESLIIITRGGLFFGGLLAEYLNIRLIHTISVESYTNEKRKPLKILGSPSASMPNPLIVDDICDSGMTLEYVTRQFQAPAATLFFKPAASKIKPDFYLHETDNWIEFPWEVKF